MEDFTHHADETLVSLLQQGSEAAFTAVYGRYFDPLFVGAIKLVADADHAMDIVQDVFTELWQHRASLGVTASLKAYLYGAVSHAALNAIKHRKVSDRYIQHLMAAAETPAPMADQRLRERELQAAIDDAVSKLPARMRTVYELTRNENLTHREVAEKLGISEHTVKAQVSNSLKSLRESLAKWIFFLLISCGLSLFSIFI